MWQRASKIAPWLLLLMAPVFWWLFADVQWTLVPLFSVACLLVVQARIRKRRPSTLKLNVTLGALIFGFNVVIAIWPEAIDEVPQEARSLWNRKESVDRAAVKNIDPAVVEAREFLRNYVLRTSDAEAKALALEFAKLAERSRRGALDRADRTRQRQLLRRYRRWSAGVRQTGEAGPPMTSGDAGVGVR